MKLVIIAKTTLILAGIAAGVDLAGSPTTAQQIAPRPGVRNYLFGQCAAGYSGSPVLNGSYGCRGARQLCGRGYVPVNLHIEDADHAAYSFPAEPSPWMTSCRPIRGGSSFRPWGYCRHP